jgi:type III secretion system-like peptide-binding chaperone
MPTAIDRTRDRARLVLQERGLPYEAVGDDRLDVGYGSAVLAISVKTMGASTVMLITACVLDHVELQDDEAEFSLLRSLNERNRVVPYGKFFFDRARGEIHVEYELLGDHLQDEEFLNALTTVAELADKHDDSLQHELAGGRRGSERSTSSGATRSL